MEHDTHLYLPKNQGSPIPTPFTIIIPRLCVELRGAKQQEMPWPEFRPRYSTEHSGLPLVNFGRFARIQIECSGALRFIFRQGQSFIESFDLNQHIFIIRDVSF